MLNFQFQGNRKLRDEITSSRLNAILTELRRIRPVAGRGINIQQEGNGTRISALDSFVSGGGGGASARQPWDLVPRVDPGADPEDENPPYLVKVRPGTLNGFLPTNWDEEFQCQSSGTHFAKAIVATDGRDQTGVTIEINTNAPSSQIPQEFGIQTSIEIVFGLFAEGASYRTIGPGNIPASPKLWLTTQRQEPPEPGELPFSQYFLFR
jgi:hypothetical protein